MTEIKIVKLADALVSASKYDPFIDQVSSIGEDEAVIAEIDEKFHNAYYNLRNRLQVRRMEGQVSVFSRKGIIYLRRKVAK